MLTEILAHCEYVSISDGDIIKIRTITVGNFRITIVS